MKTKIRTYKMKEATGFAPNYFGEILTLATCKAGVRQQAKTGEWVAGFTSKSLNKDEVGKERLVYLMKVEKNIDFAEYWEKYPQKREDKNALGDNIYFTKTQAEQNGYKYNITKDKKYLQAQPCYHHLEEEVIKKDLKSENVLICEDTYKYRYFGTTKPLEIPDNLKIDIPKATAPYGIVSEGEKVEKFIDIVLKQKNNFDVDYKNPKCEFDSCGNKIKKKKSFIAKLSCMLILFLLCFFKINAQTNEDVNMTLSYIINGNYDYKMEVRYDRETQKLHFINDEERNKFANQLNKEPSFFEYTYCFLYDINKNRASNYNTQNKSFSFNVEVSDIYYSDFPNYINFYGLCLSFPSAYLLPTQTKKSDSDLYSPTYYKQIFEFPVPDTKTAQKIEKNINDCALLFVFKIDKVEKRKPYNIENYIMCNTQEVYIVNKKTQEVYIKLNTMSLNTNTYETKEEIFERKDKEFYDFFVKFKTDENFQYQSVADTLKTRYLEIIEKYADFFKSLIVGYGEVMLSMDECSSIFKNKQNEYEYIAGWCYSEAYLKLTFKKINGKWQLIKLWTLANDDDYYDSL